MDCPTEIWLWRRSSVNRRLPLSQVRLIILFVFMGKLTVYRFDVPHDCSVELSPNGYKFLTDLFEAFDKDQDGALNQDELTDLFSTSPGNPWAAQQFPETTVANDAGAVTLQGWLAQWSMTTLLDHKTTLAYLAYFGYPSPRISALHVTRPRKAERRKGKSTRNVFLCYICGAAGSGKTSLLRAFVGRKFGETYQPTKKMSSVVNSVDIEGSEKYLVVSVLLVLLIFFFWGGSILTVVYFALAARVRLEVRGRNPQELEENRPCRRHCLRLRFE